MRPLRPKRSHSPGYQTHRVLRLPIGSVLCTVFLVSGCGPEEDATPPAPDTSVADLADTRTADPLDVEDVDGVEKERLFLPTSRWDWYTSDYHYTTFHVVLQVAPSLIDEITREQDQVRAAAEPLVGPCYDSYEDVTVEGDAVEAFVAALPEAWGIGVDDAAVYYRCEPTFDGLPVETNWPDADTGYDEPDTDAGYNEPDADTSDDELDTTDDELDTSDEELDATDTDGEDVDPDVGDTDAAPTYRTRLDESFDAEAPETWVRADWSNGEPFYCGWCPEQVTLSDGVLAIALEARECHGFAHASGELRTVDAYGYGRYTVRMRASSAAGTISSFFTYTGPSEGTEHDEIDVEFIGANPTEVQVNYWRAGQEHPHTIPLGFDASADFHTYAIEWHPEHLRWYVDDVLVHEVRENGQDNLDSLPRHPGRIMMNLWPATGVDDWSGVYVDGTSASAAYEFVRFEALE